MEANGADKYPQAFLEKQWKGMVAADAAAAVANGVHGGVAFDADGEAQPNGAPNEEADGEDNAVSD